MWRRAEKSAPIWAELHERANLSLHTKLGCRGEVLEQKKEWAF